MAGCCFNSSDIGWPIPPAAPRTATFCWFYKSYHKRKLKLIAGTLSVDSSFWKPQQKKIKQSDYLSSYRETSYSFAGALQTESGS